MPSKKKKYNARFPAGRIKKIMQSDEEIGKVAQAVPVIISRTLELFVESLLKKTLKITNSRNAKTLSTSHMKQCIMSEQRFDFLRELVRSIPDISVAEETANYNEEEADSSPEETYPDSDTPFDLSMPSTSTQAIRGVQNIQRYVSQNGTEPISSNTNTLNEQNRACLKRESDVIHRLQHDDEAAVSGNGNKSVIMHTNRIANLSPERSHSKLIRSESTPTNSSKRSQQSPDQKQRQRFKHQSQSLSYANINNEKSLFSKKPNRHIQDKTQSHTHSNVSTPIISVDFCTKPVVKIDYSNLSMPTTTVVPAPLSAPPNTSNSAFNFNADPVINIDLTNIVPSTKESSTSNGAPLATVNIGTFSSGDSQVTKSKASMAAPLTSFKTTATTKNKNSFFELDEDYDNI